MIIAQPMVHLSDVYVSIGQAASFLLVNRLTVRRWLEQGKLRGERIGRTTLILKEDVWSVAQQRGIDLSR